MMTSAHAHTPAAEDAVLDAPASEQELSLAAALGAEWESAPWYLSSVTLHTLLFLILLLLPVTPPPPLKPKIVVITDVIHVDEPPDEPRPAVEEEENPVPTNEEFEIGPIIITNDFELAERNETADELDLQSARGEPDCIATFDEVKGTPALLGVGASGGESGAGRFGNRDQGGRKNLARKGGGGPATERAVDWALRWLKEHQERDGRWDARKYGGGQSHEPRNCDASVTALALLAFLGAGNTHVFGEHKEVVRRGVEWLKRQQAPSGLIGQHRYEGGITMLAMVEAYGMSEDPTLRPVAQRAVDYALKTQGPAGGWRYLPDRPLDVDTSVTGWWVMGLKSAKIADLHLPPTASDKALRYFQQATLVEAPDRATVSYSSEAETVNQVQRGGGSTTMTAVALVGLQFLGRDRQDPQVQACAAQSLADGLPSAGNLDFYRWYYATLGLYQLGARSAAWEEWNPAMVRALLETQVTAGTFRENKGSWNPETDLWGAAWGRVGQTAMGALMFEVYYRYRNVHEQRLRVK